MKHCAAKLSIVALLLSAGTLTMAQDSDGHDSDRHKDRGRHMWREGMDDPARMIERMGRHLDLDEAQLVQLQNIVDAARPELDRVRDSLDESRSAMRNLDPADPDYSVKLQNLSASIGDLVGQMTLALGGIRADVHAVLTPDQIAMIAERKSSFRHRGGRHNREEQTL